MVTHVLTTNTGAQVTVEVGEADGFVVVTITHSEHPNRQISKIFPNTDRGGDNAIEFLQSLIHSPNKHHN